MRYVIIGNSAAAVGCAEGIRSLDKSGEVVLVSDEPFHTYSRPLISYYLQGKVAEEKTRYRGEEFYKENGLTLLAPEKVVSVDVKAKEARLESGGSIKYGKLLLATGSSPFTPPMEGLSSVARKRHFMSMADAKGLAESVGPQSRVLIIGAGLIGLKCAEGLKSRVKSIDIVDLAPRVLSSVLDEEGARLMQDRLEEEGIRLHLSTSVSRFSGSSARLAGGAELEFDELVLAVGVMPNIQLAKDAGIKTERGIVANSRMETSEPDVYAAGDNTLSFDVSSGRRKVLALLPNAYSQGECAGINMAGGCAVFDKAIPMNAIGLFGLHALTAGTFEGEVWKSSEKGIYKKLFIGDDVLNGFMIVGDPSRAGIYTSLVRERTPLGSLDFKLLRDRPSLAAFASPWRKAKLGGAL